MKKVLGVIPRSGVSLIDSAIGKFQGIIDEINEGTKKVGEKVKGNTDKITSLEKENTFLNNKVEEANIFKTNLENMLSTSKKIVGELDDEDEEPTIGIKD